MSVSYDEACEILEGLSEQYGELLTQYNSEVALYGDAWPGAALQLESLMEQVKKAEARVAELSPATAPIVLDGSEQEVMGAGDDPDLPF